MNETIPTPENAEQPTGWPVSRIQTDLFCQRCGANLYGLPVWRTEGTDLLVVTCEHCRKIASADEALPYRRVWRQRLGLTLMLGWMTLMGGSLVGVIGVEATLQSESMARQYSSGSRHSDRIAWKRIRRNLTWSLPLSLAVAGMAGVGLACGCYHWSRPQALLAAAAVPMVAHAFLWPRYADFRLSMAVPLAVMAIQIAAGVVGVLIGRGVGRATILALLPNRGRKYFGFLWRRDGRETPMGPH